MVRLTRHKKSKRRRSRKYKQRAGGDKDFVKLNREINGEYALVIVELF